MVWQKINVDTWTQVEEIHLHFQNFIRTNN